MSIEKYKKRFIQQQYTQKKKTKYIYNKIPWSGLTRQKRDHRIINGNAADTQMEWISFCFCFIF